MLAIYSSASEPDWADDDGVTDVVAHTVVLASPEGDLYRVVDLPADLNVSLLRWDAGSTTAVVRVDGERGTSQAVAERAVLDLVSGAVTPTELGLEGGGSYGHYYLGQAADGAVALDRRRRARTPTRRTSSGSPTEAHPSRRRRRVPVAARPDATLARVERAP